MDEAHETLSAGVQELTCQVCGSTDPPPYTTDPEGNFVRCRACRLIFNTRPFDPAQLIDDHYDAAEFFAAYERRRPHKVWDDGRRLDAVLGYVSGTDYLDIGCGLGTFLEVAEQRGLKAIGIDIGEYPVNYCRERGLQAQVGSLTETGFDDDSFDLVTASNVLEHIPRTEDGLVEVRRILRPGGIFAFIIPNGDYLKARLLRGTYLYYHGLRARVHYTYHNRRTITMLMRRTGFQPLRYPWLVTRRLRCPYGRTSELTNAALGDSKPVGRPPRTSRVVLSTPLGALGELAIFLPRSLGRQLRYTCRMEKELFIIARAL